MKDFDLNAAMAGKPIQKRNGERVTFVTYLPHAEKYNQVVVLDAEKKVLVYSNEGVYNIFGDSCTYDLFMAPEKKMVWINLYECGDAFYYHSQWKADTNAGVTNHRIGGRAYPVEVEI